MWQAVSPKFLTLAFISYATSTLVTKSQHLVLAKCLHNLFNKNLKSLGPNKEIISALNVRPYMRASRLKKSWLLSYPEQWLRCALSPFSGPHATSHWGCSIHSRWPVCSPSGELIWSAPCAGKPKKVCLSRACCRMGACCPVCSWPRELWLLKLKCQTLQSAPNIPGICISESQSDLSLKCTRHPCKSMQKCFFWS